MEKSSPTAEAPPKGYGRLGTLLAVGGLVVSLAVMAVLVGDLRETAYRLDQLRWQWLIGATLLALVDYGLRYLRWEVLLRQVGRGQLDRFTGVLAYCAGSLLIFTPARVGEVAKSVYARDFFGIPIAASLPILVAERLNDVAVMAVLGGLGLLLLGETSALWLAGATLSVILVAVALVSFLSNRWAHGQTRWRNINSRLRTILSLANQSRRVLLTPVALAANLGLGTLAWAIQVSIYSLSIAASGTPLHPQLLMGALAVYPLASLAGSLSLLPAGLLATEVGLVGLGVLLGGLPTEVAVLAALLTRAMTLGIVVAAGLISIGLLRLKVHPAVGGTRPHHSAEPRP